MADLGFDVFLSHNSGDKPIAERLAHQLEVEGLKVWFDKWDLIPGEPWQEAIEEALNDCRTIAVLFGPSGIGPWENEEMRTALERRVRDRSRRVIPVLLPGAPDPREDPLPPFMNRLTYVDLRSGIEEREEFSRLIAGIRGERPGRTAGRKNRPGTPRHKVDFPLRSCPDWISIATPPVWSV